MKGGVEELGNFAEGFCLKTTANNAGDELAWIMCASSLNEKDEWISHIAGVKGKFTAFT